MCIQKKRRWKCAQGMIPFHGSSTCNAVMLSLIVNGVCYLHVLNFSCCEIPVATAHKRYDSGENS